MLKLTKLGLFLLLLPLAVFAQESSKEQIGQKFVEENFKSLGLEQSDVQDYIITDVVNHTHNGVTSVYLNQTIDGIIIKDAVMNLNVTKRDRVGFHRSQFVANAHAKVTTKTGSLTAKNALETAIDDLEIPALRSAINLKQISQHKYVVEAGPVSEMDIPVEKVYIQNDAGQLVLTWQIAIGKNGQADYWDMNIDANTGTIINKKNRTIYCAINHDNYAKAHKCDHAHHNHNHTVAAPAIGSASSDSYNVFAIPLESPNHGSSVIVKSPADPIASPYGWHDTNGVEGPEYTITRGNNVHAYLNQDGDDSSAGDEPDGGPELIFDIQHEALLEASMNTDAATVNLFYANNMFHDILYKFGFDESKGNYQVNNYGNGGFGNDPIIATEADANIPNNASFTPTGDGISGRMRMGIWAAGGINVVSISSPPEIEGPMEVALSGANWGHDFAVDQISVTAEVALARDANPQNPTFACDDVVNGDEVAGKIVLIDRGDCFFGEKALNAQEAGAVGVIICNVVGVNGGDGEELVGMAPGDENNQPTPGSFVTIPSVFSGKSTCDRIRASMSAGFPVTISIDNTIEDNGPTNVNSSLDNGVVFHEYGHGFNGRVLGGPSNPSGLSNGEQMGEGWSDFFSLFLTHEEGDTGADARGIGTYLQGQSVTGRGIRRFPYSTDMVVSPYTYDNIKGIGGEVHGVGEVWAAVIWDVYWYFVDTYGYDPDWNNTESGNFQGVRMVTDGIAFLGANPGFLDARDAIFFADEVNYDNLHNCDLWEIFARRGLGFYADQGDPDNTEDGVENFDPLPTCIQELKVSKSATSFIEAGDEVEVTLIVTNHKPEMVTEVQVTDDLPDGLSLVPGSENYPSTVSGNVIAFDLGTMETLQADTIKFTLVSDANTKSTSQFYDNLEASNPAWEIDIDQSEGFNIWLLTNSEARSGSLSYYVEETETESQQALVYKGLEVTGVNPALRFWHKINTELGSDAGFIEVSTDGGITWAIQRDFVSGGYNSDIQYGTFAIPALEGFSGYIPEWTQAYLNLSAYAGQTIDLRFKFGCDDNTITTQTDFLPGWYIDDFELLDLLIYRADACVSSAEGDDVCAGMTETIVDSDVISSTKDLSADGYSVSLFPNPASDFVTVAIGSELRNNVGLSILSVDGKVLTQKNIDIKSNETFVRFDTNDLADGFYFVSLKSGDKVLTKKLLIN